MKQSVAMGLVLIVGIAACGAAWAFLPALQPALPGVEQIAAAPLERARRLLHQYDARLTYQAAVLDQLADVGATGEEPETLSDEAFDDYQQIHERIWTAFQPMQWGERPSPARPSYGDIERQMRSGENDRLRLLEDNDTLLRDALAAVNEALAVSKGNVTGRDLVEAHRIKAAILYYQALANGVRAAVAREQALPFRHEVRTLADEASALVGVTRLVAQSGIEEQINEARRQANQARQAVKEQRQVVDGLDRSLADLRERITSFEQQRDRARSEMETLREQGIDFSRPDAAAAFAAAYLDADRRYRQADRQVQYLTTGYYPHAEIDPTGDFLTGRYIENGSPFHLTIEHGLNHLEHERAIAANVLAEREGALTQWETVLAELEDLKEAYARDESNARQRLASIRTEVDELLADWDQARTAVLEQEDAALADFERSARSARDAANAAGRWVSEAQQRAQSIPSPHKERSAYQPRTDDRWMAGFSLAQSADAHLARAWIYYDRFAAAREDAKVLQAAQSILELGDDDIVARREAAQAARQAGIEAIKEAMTDLERAHRDTGGHWTLVAQAGSTEYLLVLFGDPSYTADTIEAYRKAIENRENIPAVSRIVARLRTLESR